MYGRISVALPTKRWDDRAVITARAAGAAARGSGARQLLLRLLPACAVWLVLMLPAPGASAAVTCPNANPVVNENACKTGSSAWQVNDYSANLGGYPTQTSVDLGESVVLKVGRNAPVSQNATLTISVFRMGYYGGLGGRLVDQASGVPIDNDFTCRPMDPTTGLVDCGNWQPTYTIPGNTLPASGVYLAKLRASTGEESAVVFTVRDDSSHSRLLFVLPATTYEAYNGFGGKNLYYGTQGGNTVAGTGRAVKVSFNRPLEQAGRRQNWFFGPDQDLLEWLEKQGYEATYTDDVSVYQNPGQLLQHDTVVVSGHAEYWSLQQFNGFLAARNAGVNIASFSSNTAYWKVRYEDGGRTLVCYKTVEGGGSNGSGAVSANDWGPDGIKGTADDAVGPDGIAGTADDNPQNATTTFRDDGAPRGDPNAPPEGRVGPDMPENQLFGVMYVGDNDSVYFPMTVPAGNSGGEFASDRVWRNTGISQNQSTAIDSGNGTFDYVGWEWDSVPTQPQYTSRQPANVVRLTESNVMTADDDSWLQDEGRLRSNQPPLGQPGTVAAVKYRAPSGALVFASASMMWSYGLSEATDARIQQATYNILSDMGAQPQTPSGIALDPGGSNQAPFASFAIAPNPAKTTDAVSFDASGSRDVDGSVVDYRWDLDGNGSYETDTGSTSTVTHRYSAEGEYNVRLLVTDSGGATDLAVKTVTVIDNQPPTAALRATPNPVIAGLTTTLDASGSSDPDGTIVRYEWDLDGNGSYEANTGSSPTVTNSYASAGTVDVGLRVTDSGGKTATATLPVTVAPPGVSSYPDAIRNTAGLVGYWRLDDSAGPTLADSAGSSPAAATGGVSFGVPGGVAGDPDTAARFDGLTGSAAANLNLSGTNRVTVEFWLKWTFSNNDHIAMEFTPNYHENEGGFLIDPNAPQEGGKFAVGLGRNGSFNTAYFARPSSGQWHHYAFVLDTSAPAAEEITPYVDGAPVPFTKPNSGSGAGNFANSTLYFMSRGGSSLFGAGDLDEVAVYAGALSAATVAEHYASYGTNRRPEAAFQTSPSAPKPGQQVTFDATGSHDTDGSVVRYEWDLDGNGSYETNTGASPTATHTYAGEGEVPVSLRVTDNLTGTDVVTHTVEVVGNHPPQAALSAAPNPVLVSSNVTFTASGSTDPDGTIAAYEWDLDGNGSYETNTGPSSAASRSYESAGTYDVGVRVTDNGGKTATATLPLVVTSTGATSYSDAVLSTPGLLDYWRMGELTGPTFADSAGTTPATAVGGVTFGAPGAVAEDPNPSARFDGSTAAASANVNLSSTGRVTVEFWLRWAAYANNDALALEYTPNFNNAGGGFLVDPNSSFGKFAVSLGKGASRNVVLFNRPTAGQWHHYAFVLDTGAPASEEILPYVDGAPVPFTKPNSGTGAGNFANSTLYFMSRGASSLFGAGDLDEVALYGRALSAGTIAEHFASHGTNRRPTASFQATPGAPQPGQTVTFDASGSSDPDGTIVRYEWDLDGNGSYEANTGASPTASRSYAAGTYDVGLRVTDDRGGTGAVSRQLLVGVNQPPTAALTATPNPALVVSSVAFDASRSADPDGSIVRYEWDLDGNGSYETATGATSTASRSYASAGTYDVGLRVTDSGGATATATLPLGVKLRTYPEAVLSTAGLIGYWRMGDGSGPVFLDSAGSSPASASGGVTFGVPGALRGDANTAGRFDGVSGAAAAAVDLSKTSQVTLEFWLRWSAYSNNDALAFEFTPNFNNANGGFLVDPNSSFGKFAVSLGKGASRNVVTFARPTAGQWHHYAFVLDTSAPAAEEITPYVDGKPVAYSKPSSGTGAGNFANSTLYFMSRGGSTLFGAGDLDEVSLYGRALDAATVVQHFEAG
jgi:YD repeat-containing protein